MCVFAILASGCASVSYFPKNQEIVKSIDKVGNFPDIPGAYRYFDYSSKVI